jgi:hypothetical protein
MYLCTCHQVLLNVTSLTYKMLKIEDVEPSGVSWLVTSILLTGGMFYEVIYRDSFGSLSLVFFVSQMVYWVTTLYLYYPEDRN